MTSARRTPVTSAPCSSSVAVTNAVNPEMSARTRNPDSVRWALGMACFLRLLCHQSQAEVKPATTAAETGLQLVDEVDELAEPSEGPVVEPQQETGQVGELVELLRHGARLERGRRLQDVGEL